MVKHFYGDIEINWKDGEWERLQKIKRGEYVPDVENKPKTAILNNLRVDEELRNKLKAYAKSKGLSIPDFVRVVLSIVTECR